MSVANYDVKHCFFNPKHNYRVSCDTKKESIEELRKYSSEEIGSSSVLSKNGEQIAHRDHNKKNIRWI